jgi:hypothetical protein
MEVANPPLANRRVGLRWPPLILLVVLGWWTVRMGTGVATRCFMDLVNLAFHEAGHLFFTPLGSTMHFLGGTLGQLIVPGGLVVYFVLRRRQALGAAFCCWWFGESLVNVAVYMADARTLALPLVGGGVHDWNELFFRFGLLGESSVSRISSSVHALGALFMLVGLAWVLYFALPAARRQRIFESLTWRWPWMACLLDD